MSIVNDILAGVEKLLLGHNGGTSSAGKVPSDDIIPGDIKLQGIKLMSEDKQRAYDLTPQVVSIDVFESILSPIMYAELSISDSIGLLQSFPIIGEEYVSINFSTPGARGEHSAILMRVNQVRDKEVHENNKTVKYKIQLVSAELIRNAGRDITLPYEGTIDNIVKGILEDELGTQKSIKIDRTVGIEKGVISRLEPFRAIDYLRRKAVSNQYKSSSWVFYESRDGFFLTTIERLMAEGAKVQSTNNTDKVFFFDTNRKDSMSSTTIRNILSYNQIAFTDTISKIRNGGLSTDVTSFDIMTGSTRTVRSDPTQTYKSVDGNDSAPRNTSAFLNNHNKKTAANRFVPITSDKPDTGLAEMLSSSTAFIQSLTQNIVQVHVYGDTEIKLGDVIKCNFPRATSADDAGHARLDSGNYLITKIRHIIINSDRPQHTMALELVKGNLLESA